MARNTATGIDIGTHRVRVVVGERVKKGGKVGIRVIGTGASPSRGVRHGYIVNPSETVESVRRAIAQAESNAKTRIKSAFVSIGGASLESTIANGSAVISRADSVVSELNVEEALQSAEESSEEVNKNRKILHSVPLEFKLDNKEVLGQPAGMKGLRLEAKTLLITVLERHFDDLVQVVEEAGVVVDDIVAAPLAAGLVNLAKTERIAGVVLVNIGAETTSLVVYENNMPVTLKTFPIGSTDITNDIALGLKIPLEEAEAVKVKPDSNEYPRKKLDEIIEARLVDIMELVRAHLKKIKKDGLLPAGIVLTGGGSSVATFEDIAKAALSLPSSVAELSVASTRGVIRDPSWSVAYGLTVLALSEQGGGSPDAPRLLRGARDSMISWVRQFLP